MNYQELVNSLTPEVVDNFKRAIELGRWPDGRKLTDEQREHCMQAIIHWDLAHVSAPERTGSIDLGRKQAVRRDENEARPLRWDEAGNLKGLKSLKGENRE